MSEKGPVSITHGLEIKQETARKIQAAAIEKYKKVATLDEGLNARIDSKLSCGQTNMDIAGLMQLFEQKHLLEGLGRELEEIIMGAAVQFDRLEERWRILEERFEEALRT